MNYSVAHQGGAMRSVYCLGAVRALDDSGIARDVKSVHASSAGCVSGAILAGRAAGTTTGTVADTVEYLVDRLTGTKFIDERRVGKVVDVDYLVRVIRELAPVDGRELARRGFCFEVAVTDTSDATARYLRLDAYDEDQVDEVLRATMAIPVLYHRKVEIRGRQYVDGGIADPLPLFRAARTAPDCVIAISSLAKGDLGRAVTGRDARIVGLVPGVPTAVRRLMLVRNPLGEATATAMADSAVGGIPVVAIAPTRPELLGSRLETREPQLRALERLGYDDGCKAIADAGIA